MRAQGFSCSIVGKKRSHNEDAFVVDDGLGLYVVCDGLGGHAAGEVASHLATESVQQVLGRHAGTLDGLGQDPPRNLLQGLVRDAVLVACQTVNARSRKDPACAGMGTTLTLLLTVGNLGAVAHVGDSRLYLCRQGRVYQLSEDHCLRNELLATSELDEEDAQSLEYGHLLTRVVGLQPSVHVDCLVLEMLPGDRFLLCSDGLCKGLDDRNELAGLLSGDDPAQVPDTLVGLANERDGSDNITAVFVAIDPDDTTDEGWCGDVQLRMETLGELFLFEHLNLKELAKVLNLARSESVPDGTKLIVEGTESEALYVVLDGVLEVRKAGKHITTLGVGSHVGEMALLNHKPRSATVRAQGRARLLVLSREDFVTLLKSEPALGLKLLWSIAQELSARLDSLTERTHAKYQLAPHRLEPPPF